MKIVDWLMLKFFKKVRIRELDQVQYAGRDRYGLVEGNFYRVWATNISSRSYDVAGESNNFFEISYEEVGEKRFKTVWVDEDSFAGILSKVTFDEKHLKLHKEQK